MKKIIKNKFYDTGKFEITVEKNFIKIINIDNLSKIKNIEIYGKVDNIKKAMIISENYIEKIENRNNEYDAISEAFIKNTIFDFKLTIENMFQKKKISEFLIKEMKKITDCFKEINKNIDFLILDYKTGHFIFIDENNIESLKEKNENFDEFMKKNEKYFFKKNETVKEGK